MCGACYEQQVVVADGSQNFYDKLEQEMKREFFECDDPDICDIRTSNYNGIQTNLKTVHARIHGLRYAGS